MLTIGWSDFARLRNCEGHTYFTGTDEELIERVRKHWEIGHPGLGRDDRSKVFVVPVETDGFVASTILIDNTEELEAVVMQRQPGESSYIHVRGKGPTEPVLYAKVVLYSAEALLENGGSRSTDCDWEIVALIASTVEDEPMFPLTMARNMLHKIGGTPCEYTAEEFAEAIWYWSKRCKVKP